MLSQTKGHSCTLDSSSFTMTAQPRNCSPASNSNTKWDKKDSNRSFQLNKWCPMSSIISSLRTLTSWPKLSTWSSFNYSSKLWMMLNCLITHVMSSKANLMPQILTCLSQGSNSISSLKFSRCPTVMLSTSKPSLKITRDMFSGAWKMWGTKLSSVFCTPPRAKMPRLTGTRLKILSTSIRELGSRFLSSVHSPDLNLNPLTSKLKLWKNSPRALPQKSSVSQTSSHSPQATLLCKEQELCSLPQSNSRIAQKRQFQTPTLKSKGII